MKPMSLATAKAAVRAALNSGHQTSEVNGAEPLRDIVRKRSPDMTIPITIITTKTMANHGMTSTKRMVFSVARFAFREVRPIHIPNQHSANRLVVVLTAATTAVVAAITVSQAGLSG